MLVLTTTQQVALSIEPRDRRGNIARVDGAPTWALSNPAVGTIEPTADGLSAVFRSTAIGETQVNVTVDADLGEGVRQITSVLSIEVRAAEAVTVSVAAGLPEEQV